MAASALPGSYPDSIPPTPEETQKQQNQLDQQRQKRAKLHKHNEPRGHKQTDSGVAISERGPSHHDHHDNMSHWHRTDEANEGGADDWEHHTPLSAVIPSGSPMRTELGITTEPIAARETEGSSISNKDEDKTSVPAIINTSIVEGGAGKNEPKASQQQQHQNPEQSRPPSDEPTSQLGDSSRGAEGAVYNTVMGHGSAADDHEDHHHLPPKSSSNSLSARRAVVEGDITSYPRGSGVYNTVTGYGSQDDEVRRRSREIALGFPSETAVRDDAYFADVSVKHGASPHQPRAFPLVTGPSVDHSNLQTLEFPSRDKTDAAPGLAGVIGPGTSAATAKYVGKRRKGSTAADQDQEGLDVPTKGGRERNQVVAAGGASMGNEQRSSRPISPVGKVDGDKEESSNCDSRSRKHGILSIFHWHKSDTGEKSRRKSLGDHPEPVNQDATVAGNHPSRLRKPNRGESTTEHRRSRSSVRTEDEDRPYRTKDKTVAGGAAAAGTAMAGAGVFGFSRHAKGQNTSDDFRENTHNKIKNNRVPATAGASNANPAGETLHQIDEVPTPFEHPREPPTRPDGVSQGITMTGAAGLTSKGHMPGAENQRGMTQEMQQEKTGTTTTNEQEDNYNILASSGVPMDVRSADAHEGPGSEPAPSQPGDYSVLASTGTPLSKPVAEKATRRGNGDNEEDQVEYNTLPSGTPSGVKVKTKPHRQSSHLDTTAATTTTTTHDYNNSNNNINQISDTHLDRIGGNNSLTAAAAAAGVARAVGHGSTYNTMTTTPSAHQQQEQEQQQQQRQHEEPPPPSPQTEHESLRVPVPRIISSASQESLPGVTTYGPGPGTGATAAEHKTSPEVMPSAYVASASAPRSSPSSSQYYTSEGGRVIHVCRHCGLADDITDYLRHGAGSARDGSVPRQGV